MGQATYSSVPKVRRVRFEKYDDPERKGEWQNAYDREQEARQVKQINVDK